MENLLICSISLTNDKKLENVHVPFAYMHMYMCMCMCMYLKGVVLIRTPRDIYEGRERVRVTGKSTAQHKLA